MQETPVQILGQEDLLEKGYATHSNILRLPCGSDGKESACNAGDLGSIPGSGRSAGEGTGYPLQYSWAIALITPELHLLSLDSHESVNPMVNCLSKASTGKTIALTRRTFVGKVMSLLFNMLSRMK